jgi:hypothetical protein
MMGTLAASPMAQQIATTDLTCKLFVENGLWAPEGRPLVTAPDINIPKIRLVMSGDSHIDTIRIWYTWKWLEYPYPEHPFGAWSDAEDIVDCNTGGATSATIPSYTVHPKGWVRPQT